MTDDINSGEESIFWYITPDKLAVMSFVTFRLYEVFWLYKNWTYIKNTKNPKMLPFWRAWFSLVTNIRDQDLKATNSTANAAYPQAYANLEGLLKSNQIQMSGFPKGPNEAPFMVIGGHWCSAACILLPGIYEMGKKTLRSERVVAFIPHRDVYCYFQCRTKREWIDFVRL